MTFLLFGCDPVTDAVVLLLTFPTPFERGLAQIRWRHAPLVFRAVDV